MENWVFFKRWLSKPHVLGTCFPISHKLARAGVDCILADKDKPIIELGSGTGRFTQALIDAGFSNITLVEIDPELCAFLRKRFEGYPQIRTIIEGDARQLCKIAPHMVQKTRTVVSVIPLMYLSLDDRVHITKESFNMLDEHGRFLHICYTPFSPLKGVYMAKALFKTFLNIPPGFVWEFFEKDECRARAS